MDLANVNVTLGLSGSGREWLLGKEFPCPVCGAAMPVRLTFKKKPYCHCSSSRQTRNSAFRRNHKVWSFNIRERFRYRSGCKSI
jgi:hypothetical protein